MRYTVIAALLFSGTALADVPYAFQQGTPARAAEVNANFQALDSAVSGALGSIELVSVTATNPGASGAVCPDDTVGVSSSCGCDNADGARNFGVLFTCSIEEAGAVAGCFPEAATFDSGKGMPLATATALCARIAKVDGTAAKSVGLHNVDATLSKITRQAHALRR